MRLLGSPIRLFANISQALSVFFNRVSRLLEGLVPAVLPPSQLNALTRESYVDYYSKVSTKEDLPQKGDELEQWETQVFNTHHVDAGRMLVLGSGLGRESLAIAQRGVTVVGVDTNDLAVRTAVQFAGRMGARAHFSIASFLELPFASGSFDFVLLTDVMYSAIPDASARQTWLTGLRHVLKPNGLVILSFEAEREPASRLTPICGRLNAMLVKLPGANKAYQRGDAYAYGHFIHFFQDEREIRNELLDAHVAIQELSWDHGYAVVRHFPSIHPSS